MDVEDLVKSIIEAAPEDAEQSGVKGMKWGVTKESGTNNHSVFVATGSKPKIGQEFVHDGQTHVVNRAVTRADGKHIITTQQQAKAQLGQKLVAGLKKDKEYWHKQAAILGVVGTGLAAAALAPALVPASVIAAGGGAAIVSGKITLGVGIAARGAYVHNYVKWRGRVKAQTALGHADMSDNRTLGEVYDQLSGSKKLAADLIVAAFSKGEEVADDPDIQSGWADMSPIERSTVLFFASGSLPEGTPSPIAHSDLMALIEAEPEDAEQSGVKGMKWGVRRSVDPSTGLAKGIPPGLKARVGSADQIHQDRIQKKIDTVGIHSLSTAELKSYTSRLQAEKEVSRVLAEQSAVTKAKADGFIKSFVKRQGDRQVNRVLNAATDIAVEKALEKAGIKVSGVKLSDISKKDGITSKSEFGDTLQVLSGRIKPKKGK